MGFIFQLCAPCDPHTSSIGQKLSKVDITSSFELPISYLYIYLSNVVHYLPVYIYIYKEESHIEYIITNRV